ncbi:MAG TPA: FAD-dependent oxidoreductase [Syntrophorhabdales bacterium]|nr:FAD-dependent oxidoreductase [Syntrophorhabdales bacterium]
MAKKTIVEDAREIEVMGEYDVLVVGGGGAGIAAAIAAERSGARTLLVERYGFLGGMATAGMVGSFCGFFTTGAEKKLIVGGVAGSLRDRLKERGSVTERGISKVDPRIASLRFHPEIFKFVAEEFATKSGVELLYHSFVTDVTWEQKGSRLSGVIVENKSGRCALLAKVIIDASGDGDVAFRAGVPCEVGDEKGRLQTLTTMFRMIHVDVEKMHDLTTPKVKEKLEEAVKTGEYGFKRPDGILNPALPSGLVSANIVSVPDLIATDARDLTAAEMEGRRQVLEYIRAFRRYLPGFEQAELSSFAPQIGIRETRRIKGSYVLQEDDVLKGRKFDDGIALGAWPMEMHDPETRRIIWKFLEKEDDYYTIPIRCLIPSGVENLLVAGRCLSASHQAHASARVIGPAFAMGEAAGILAAQSVGSNALPKEISPEDVRRELRQYGAILEA